MQRIAGGAFMAVLGLAGVAKLYDLPAFALSLGGWHLVPDALAVPLAASIAGFEFALGIAWFLRIRADHLLRAGGFWLAAATLAFSIEWIIDGPPNCNCFGTWAAFLSRQEAAPFVIARNLILLAVWAWASAPRWLAGRSLIAAMGTLLTGALVVIAMNRPAASPAASPVTFGNSSLPPAESGTGPASLHRATSEESLQRSRVEENATGDGLLVIVRDAVRRTPVAHVEVTVLDLRHMYRWVRTRPSDEKGIALFENLPGGSFGIRAPTGAYAAVEYEAGRRSVVELLLRPGATVQGVVVDQERHPVAGAEIGCQAPESMAVVDVIGRSGEDGRFSVGPVPSGFALLARKAGHGPSPKATVNAAERELELVLTPEGASVEVKLVDPRGVPLPGGLVELLFEAASRAAWGSDLGMPAGARLRGITDAAGVVCFAGLSAARARALGRHEAFASASAVFELDAEEHKEMQLRLPSAGRVMGHVRYTDGRSVSDATVSHGEQGCLDFSGTRTTADGGFDLEGLPAGDLFLDVTIAGSSFRRAARATVEGAYLAVEVPSFGDISGRVVDDLGRPIPSLGVQAKVVSGRLDAPRSVMTGVDGSFRFADLPAPQRLSVYDPATGCTLLDGGIVAPGEAARTYQVPLARRPSAFLTGKLQNLDDPSSVRVLVRGLEDEQVAAFHVEPTGHYRAGPLPAGRYRVGVKAPNVPIYTLGEFELAVGQDLTIGSRQLPPASSIVVGVAGASTTDVLLHSAWNETAAATRTDKGWHLVRIWPGTYSLQVHSATCILARRLDVADTGGSTQSFTVEIPEATIIRLHLQAPPASRGRQYRVELSAEDGALVWREVWTGEAVARDLRLARGSYRVRASTRDGLSADEAFDVSGGAPRVLEITLR